jgi:PAS domain S-box-containing protein
MDGGSNMSWKPNEYDGLSRVRKSDSRQNLSLREVRSNTQNNQLRRAEINVDAASSHYRALFELAPLAYLVTDEQGAILEINLRAAQLVGGVAANMTGRNFKFMIAPEDQTTYRLTRSLLKGTDRSAICELRMRGVAVVEFWARLEMATRKIGNTKVCQIVITDMTDRKLAEQQLLEKNCQLQRELEKSQTLVREAYHRVRNNLQAILGVLRVQIELLGDDSACAALNDSRRRLLSMAFTHERLYESEIREHIDFGEYTCALVNELFDSFSGSSAYVTRRLHTTRVILNSNQAIPCGLILNELVTNALKYAYPNDQRGEIRVQLDEDTSGLVTLAVSDDGVGLPEGFEWQESHSMGLFIVANLVKQIGGTWKLGPSPGTSFIVQFPKSSRAVNSQMEPK